MNTFVPNVSSSVCAMLLDNARLNKQITETKQLINAIETAVMWRNYMEALKAYGRSCLNEWYMRGGKGHMHDNFQMYTKTWDTPWWVGAEPVHRSHQSRLMHKGEVDTLRKRIKNWPEFRSKHCPNLPKEWNLFKPQHATNW
jgi:hypothetical protein